MTSSFSYQATSVQGIPISGSIHAGSIEHAREQLSALQLSILDLQPQVDVQPRTGAMTSLDFIAFNEQLAHLTSNGMPVEEGLRLIAEDLHSGRLKSTVQQLSRELESGTSLSDALSRHASEFPPLYSQLIDAGVQTSNLPAMLLNIGRHADMIQRLKQQLWKALSYPAAMFLAATALITFVGWMILPRLWVVVSDFRLETPSATQVFMTLGQYVPYLLIAVCAIALFILVFWSSLKRTAPGRWITESLFLRLPLIGPALKFNLLARWCDAMRIAIDGSLDLPRAIDLAGSVIASPRVLADSQKLKEAAVGGVPLHSTTPLSILPATIPATIDFASKNGQLSPALATLSHLYQQQAELRTGAIPTILTPLIIIPVALMVGGAILSLMLPMISLIQSVSSPSKK